VIIFTDAKIRSGNGFGGPEDFAGCGKQKLPAEAAEEYIYLRDHKGMCGLIISAV
jgi:putative endonuclease